MPQLIVAGWIFGQIVHFMGIVLQVVTGMPSGMARGLRVMHFSLVQLWTKEEDMMRCMIFLAVFLSTSAGADRAEFTLGGVEGNAWQVPLAQER